MKPSGWLESVNCAIEGILWTVRTQRHMRLHFLGAVAVLLVALLLRVSALDFVLLSFAVTLVLFAELVNTALEVVVDMVSPDYHPLAKRAKDIAAGSVLVASIGAVVMGYMALGRYVFPESTGGATGAPAPGMLPVLSVLVVVILVVLLKAIVGRGTPLHGGMPSGHAAVAFAIASSVALSGAGPVVTLLVLGVAAMVSHSRLLLGIHTLREVLAGALLGAAVTLMLYIFFA